MNSQFLWPYWIWITLKCIMTSWAILRGDELLKKVSRKIKENIRSTDIAARYGGDAICGYLSEYLLQGRYTSCRTYPRQYRKDIRVPASMTPYLCLLESQSFQGMD